MSDSLASASPWLIANEPAVRLAVFLGLFGTYRAEPRDGHTAMRTGLAYFRAPRDHGLRSLLIQPLRRVRENDLDGGMMS